MKYPASIAILLTLLTASAFAQDQSADSKAACGPESVRFAVKQQDSQHAPSQPQPGRALIYFVQQTGAANCSLGAPCVTKIGLDGTWVGAFQNNSYFSVSVDPGEHHACMNLQSHSPLGKQVAFAHLTVEPGSVYYLGTKAIVRSGTTRLMIDPIDSDEAKHLIASSPLSVSQPKK